MVRLLEWLLGEVEGKIKEKLEMGMMISVGIDEFTL
jgi:hypothetical protein